MPMTEILPSVLVSYRREDSAGFARILYDRLAQRFPDRVFMDIEKIEPGTDFVESITQSVRQAAVVVAVIGMRWSGTSVSAKTRLLEPNDFVRLEIAAALSFKIRVIPVLLPKATLPDSGDLPEELLPLLRIQALSLTDAHLQDDVDQLVDIIARQFSEDMDPVTISGMPSNQGWSAILSIRESEIREIFIRIDGQGEFRSTGFEATRSARTGIPMPRIHFQLHKDLQDHDIEVKYINARGQVRGPFHMHFDAATELVRSTRSVLDMTEWIGFGGNEGRRLVYFTNLLCYKNAFREIRYSMGNDSLDRKLQFKRVPSHVLPGIDDSDECYFELPPGCKFVCVKLYYIDGTESVLSTFPWNE